MTTIHESPASPTPRTRLTLELVVEVDTGSDVQPVDDTNPDQDCYRDLLMTLLETHVDHAARTLILAPLNLEFIGLACTIRHDL